MIAQTIGVADGDNNTLCQSDNITKWSRRKPMHLKNWFHPLTEAKLYEGRFGFKWDYNRTLLGQYGTSLVPTVFTEDYIRPDGDTTKVVEASVENIRLFKRWWYEVVPTGGGFNGSNDFGKPAGAVADGNASPARESDFAGYDHAAGPIMQSAGLELSEGNYTITIRVARPSENYGGITPNDFQPDTGTVGADLTGWYVHLFIISRKIITTSARSDYRYGYCQESGAYLTGRLIGETDTEIRISIPENHLDHLFGDWLVVAALGEDAIGYEESEESWPINDNGALAYPRLKAAYVGKTVYPVENMIYAVHFPDGEGTVIWDGSAGIVLDGHYLSRVTSAMDVTLVGDTLTGGTTATFVRFDHTRYYRYSGIIVSMETDSIQKTVRRKYRRLTFESHTPGSYLSSNDYLNYCSTNQDSGNVGGGLKPIARNLPTMKNGSAYYYLADIYLEYIAATGTEAATSRIVVRYKDFGGTTVFHTEYYTIGWSVTKNMYNSIALYNVVDGLKNTVTGFGMEIVYRKDLYDTTESLFLTENFDISSYFEGSTFNPYFGSDTLEIMLPEDLVAEPTHQHLRGGDLYIRYSADK